MIYGFLKGKLLPFLETRVWPFLRDRFWPLFEKLASAFLNTLERVWLTIEQHWPNIEKWILTELENFFAGITRTFETGIVGLIYKTSGFWAAMEALWGSRSLNLWDKLVITVGLAVDSLVQNFNLIGAIIGGLIGSAFGPLGAVIGAVIGGFFNLIASLLNMTGIVSLVGQFFQALGRAIADLPRAIAGVIIGLVQLPVRIIEAISWAIREIVRWLINRIIDLINFITPWPIPDIPYLQHGAIVHRPTLAVVGEMGPEAVIPLHRISEFSWARSEPVILNIHIGNERIARFVLKELRSQNLLATGQALNPVAI
jgi:hypothetical protein